VRSIHVAGIAAGVAAILGAGVALAASRRPEPPVRRPAPASTSPLAGGGGRAVASPASPDGSPGADDPIVAPAYPYLDAWTPEERRALLDLQRELGLDPKVGGLAGVIGHESGGNPAAPEKKSGTPRGGLIQVTVKANLPGYATEDAVWGIRGQDRVTQLRGVVRDFMRRQLPHGPPSDQGAAAMLRRNYLPNIASKPSTFVLGVRHGSIGPGGERPDDHLAGGLTLGANYAANPGFDQAGRGWFTWADVDRQAANAEQGARSRGWVRVSGARVQPGDLPVAGATGLEVADAGIESLRCGWVEVIATRDAAPADCPCRDATSPMIANWLKFDEDFRRQTAGGEPYGGTRQAELFAIDYYWKVLDAARKVQSGAAGGDVLPGEFAIDVREKAEFGSATRPGAENFPVSEIDRDGLGAVVDMAAGRPIVVYCKAGVRAERIVRQLRAAGHAARNGHEDVACKFAGDVKPEQKSEAALWT